MKHQELNGWRSLDLSVIQDRLQLPSSEMQRWQQLPDGEDWDEAGSVMLPSNEAAADLLIRLSVDDADVAGLLATRPDEHRDPELWWLLDRSSRLLMGQMGRPGPDYRPWPAIEAAGPVGDFLYVWAFLAALPAVRAYHASVGLSDDESWDSLAVLGKDVRAACAGTRTGLGPTWMLPLVFSGVSFRLGRLAFDQRYPQGTGEHPVLRPGEGSWNIHVPSGAGPITPAACTASMGRALELSRRLPAMAAVFCCHSWLMDPQLVDLLPPDSNIVGFQSRFDHFTDCRVADSDPIHYIFRRRFNGAGELDVLLDQLPQDTTLQRAIVAALRSGGHWHTRTGWLRVPHPPAIGNRTTPATTDHSSEGRAV